MEYHKMISLLQQVINLIKNEQNIISEKESIIKLLHSDEWPEAIPNFLICKDSEADKIERAESILDYVGRKNIRGKKFLDFGCGDGLTAIKAANIASKSVGYELHEVNLKEVEKNYIITKDFFKVRKNGPYDTVLLYDVLDHCNDPIVTLNQVKSICDSKSKIFVRCHPWMSRHASHLYKQINKAWIHIFFTEEELNSMEYKTNSSNKYYFPVDTQKKWFENAKLKIVHQDIVKTEIEPFFRKPELISRLPREFKNFPEHQMSQLFNDYILQIETNETNIQMDYRKYV